MAVALLLAAGRGERLGSDRPKALAQLAGRPMLQWSLDVLAGAGAIERIAIALPPGTDTAPGAVRLPANAVCVEGGAVRSASVRLALAAAGPGDPVLVHDAARPLLSAELVGRTLAAVMAGDVEGAIAAVPVSDTIKRAAASGRHGAALAEEDGEPPAVEEDVELPAVVEDGEPPAAEEDGEPPAAEEDGELPTVVETLDRSGLWAVQTPQAFRRRALERALDVPDDVLAAATDDAWLVERSGGRVVIVPSDPGNLKVTSSVDLLLAEMLLARGPG